MDTTSQPTTEELERVTKGLARAVGSVLKRSAASMIPWAAEFAPNALVWQQQLDAAEAAGDEAALHRLGENLKQLEYLGVVSLSRAGVNTQAVGEGVLNVAVGVALRALSVK